MSTGDPNHTIRDSNQTKSPAPDTNQRESRRKREVEVDLLNDEEGVIWAHSLKSVYVQEYYDLVYLVVLLRLNIEFHRCNHGNRSNDNI